MSKVCVVCRLGVTEYEKAWWLQEAFAAEIARGDRPPTLLLLEHPHTYTFGRSGHLENLLWDEKEQKQRGVTDHWVDRGGDVTYHGPGQLVGYPLFPLGTLFNPGTSQHLVDYVGYIRKLEMASIKALAQFGIPGERVEGMSGVWVERKLHPRLATGSQSKMLHAQRQMPAKIAAIGVKVDVHGISRHGFALNVNPDSIISIIRGKAQPLP